MKPQPSDVIDPALVHKSSALPITNSINISDEDGLVTAEYAVAIFAAVAFAGVLMAVVKSNAVRAALTAIIQSALSM
ncbi:MAG: DUF4244 domain-containing protein [Actinomycetaceae bacterium]|nr:DUF4244 domain-containing protein [Actinomycetaceae bacterium]